MNIFYDENIPYAEEFFSDFGKLIPFAGRELSASQVKDADVLLVRSITQVNERLLKDNRRIKFVGTATIGIDHVDTEYLAKRGVYFTNAPGCNAISVAEYVLSALLIVAKRTNLDLSDIRVGIVGAGNTGTRLAEKLDAVGIKYCLCDPLLAEAGDVRPFTCLEDVLTCDVISLHVPLTRDGLHPTYHLLDETRLSQLSNQQILINACRGEVVDNNALLALKKGEVGPHLVLDVWEDEPNVLTPLIDYCQLTTAHIAGYSLEGKSRGTEMLYQALSKQCQLKADKQLTQFLPTATFAPVTAKSGDKFSDLSQYVWQVYDVRRDDQIFRQQLQQQGFDHLRKNYPVRREFSAMTIESEHNALTAELAALGFNI
ncbi:4-phosphoerythronate dehydrogenase [Thalassotalea aquiviva]|uniref:4-phosphoerythronate dehydrogenase n=1 Tax=Thalassotalea aquiviva TaxID=3242415 RepID=UPI00352A8899